MMAKEYGKFPHEVVELDLGDWSFNLFCMIKSQEESKPQEYSKEVMDIVPKMKDPEHLKKLSEYSDKLPKRMVR
jgi:hypothetical protein